MRSTSFAALLCAALLVGCGAGAPASPRPQPPHPTQTAVVYHPPQSAITPEGAKPVPPLTGVGVFPGETHINAAGMNLIGGFEGFSSCPYQDVVGVWTIGYGVTSGSGFHVGPFTPCESRTTGLAQLKSLILRDYEPAVHAVSSTFGQNATNALDSFDYNLGAGIFTGTLRGDLARHDYQAAGIIMLQYDHAGGRVIPGLFTRRVEEVALLRRADPRPRPRFTHAQLLHRLKSERDYIRVHHCRQPPWHAASPTRNEHKCHIVLAVGQQTHRELKS
jgi:lysozyme